MTGNTNGSNDDSKQACIAHLKAYIASFNNTNIEAIKSSLAEDVQVFVDGKLASQGRDNILPAYVQDFQVGKQVSVLVNSKQGETEVALIEKQTANKEGPRRLVHLSVNLQAKTPDDPNVVSMNVVYTYDTVQMLQIRHEITNIVVTQEKES